MSVSPEFVDEALCACEEHLNNLAHLDIDKDVATPPCLGPEGWSLFLQRYYQVVQSSAVRTSCSSCGLWYPRWTWKEIATSGS